MMKPIFLWMKQGVQYATQDCFPIVFVQMPPAANDETFKA
jgi:hypothetical protein